MSVTRLFIWRIMNKDVKRISHPKSPEPPLMNFHSKKMCKIPMRPVPEQKVIGTTMGHSFCKKCLGVTVHLISPQNTSLFYICSGWPHSSRDKIPRVFPVLRIFSLCFFP